jgi:hypothetical protein
MRSWNGEVVMSDTEQKKVYSSEDIRNAVNSEKPFEAIEIVLSLLQRMTLAVESIAQSMEEPPTVLFEQAPSTDGSSDFMLNTAGSKDHA